MLKKTPTKKHLVLLIFSFITALINAQTCPPNIDFESGNFASWECFRGDTKSNSGINVINLNLTPPDATRHQIMSSKTDKDKYGNFPVVCPYGGNYSVKLGNEQIGAGAEGVSYTFTVPGTVDSFSFTYFYAVVFEDPGHKEIEQPRFYVTAYEVATGKVINCASFSYVATGTLPGFYQSQLRRGVLYKDWSPVSLKFSGLMGKQVRLEFKNADCTLGGHFGYSYLDVGSGCSNIIATAPYCIETNSLTLNGPYGFKTYKWFNSDLSTVIGNTQNVTITPAPVTSGSFVVATTPYPGFGCNDTFRAVVKPLGIPPPPKCDPEYFFCLRQANAKITAYADSGNVLVWYKGDSTGVGSEFPPVINTNVAGDSVYYVSQKQLFGCEGFKRKIIVKVVDFSNGGIVVNDTSQCLVGNNFTFKSLASTPLNISYKWYFTNTDSLIKNSDSTVSFAFSQTGSYSVVLRADYAGKCQSVKNIIVEVEPSPQANFSTNTPICEKQTPIFFAESSTLASYTSTINKWWWNINGKIDTLQNPASFTPSNTNPIVIKMVATSTAGCQSDTLIKNIVVQSIPVPKFTVSTRPICSSEDIAIKDLSFFSNAIGAETISKWNWLIDGSTTLSTQNINPSFTYGNHNVSLMVESNFGCKSSTTDTTFFVLQKPKNVLSFNDSCINKGIWFRIKDNFNLVSKWSWNFGNGYYTSGDVESKYYTRAGNYPFYVIGTTNDNCKDTLFKNLLIYDNIAYAGNDTVVAIGQPLQLNAGGYPDQKYKWTPNLGLSSDTIVNPIALYSSDIYYYLNSVTKEGCVKNSRTHVRRYIGPAIYVATAFSPNGDKLNDILHVLPVGIKKFIHYSIYNRLGNLLFTTQNPSVGWDGKYNGELQQSGTYVVAVDCIDYLDKPLSYKGTVVLIR